MRARGTEGEACVLRLRELVRLVGLREELGLPDVAFPKHLVRDGEVLWHQGDRLESVYALGAGTFKTVAVSEHGREQVLSFAYPGEVIGLEGFAGVCVSSAVALEAGWVASVPFASLRTLATHHAPVQRLLDLLFSAEIRRCMRAVGLHGVSPSEARVAAFLLDLARRTHARLEPGITVALAMSGRELGSHLGLRAETVSRAVGALVAVRLVRGSRRSAVLLDPAGLNALAEGRPLPERASGSREARAHIGTSEPVALFPLRSPERIQR